MKFETDYEIRSYKDQARGGDTVFVKWFNDDLFIALVDAAGHGLGAYQIAQTTYNILHETASSDLVHVLNTLHNNLKNTNGIVVGLAFFDSSSNKLNFAGIGNITAKYNCRLLTSKAGLLGTRMRKPLVQTVDLTEQGLFIMHSDGVSTILEPLKNGAPKAICNNILDQYALEYDDSSVIVVRCTND